jgi:hypothetical protein
MVWWDGGGSCFVLHGSLDWSSDIWQADPTIID